MKALPYESATAGDRALAEVQKILEAFGCQNFGTGVDNERQCIVVSFKWRDRQVMMEASWKGYAAAWQQRHTWQRWPGNDRPAYDRRALEIGRRAVCSVLRDWVKGQMTALECGILQFEEVFMPHMVLENGRRVVEVAREARILPQLGHEAAP